MGRVPADEKSAQDRGPVHGLMDVQNLKKSPESEAKAFRNYVGQSGNRASSRRTISWSNSGGSGGTYKVVAVLIGACGR